MKKVISVLLTVCVLMILLICISPFVASAFPIACNGTMTSDQTVYCLPGSGMTIGSVTNHESVRVYWREGSYYYIQYVVSSGNYSGYKRGYVPVSSVSVSGVSGNAYSAYYGMVSSNKTVYNRSDSSSLVVGSVYSTDRFTIMQEEGLWYYIDYPINGGGHKRGYILRSDIIQPQGNLEAVSFSRIVGWAWDPVNPNRVIQVHVYIKNNATGEEHGYAISANISRSDLANAGYGIGNHAFEYEIDWTEYAPGTYTIRTYAINGANPQFGTMTYTTTNRKAAYFMTGRPWPNDISDYSASAIRQSTSKYQSLGFTGCFGGSTPYYTDDGTAPAALTHLQLCTVIAFHGHGNAGELSMKRSSNTIDYLFSAVHGNGGDGTFNYRSIDTLSGGSLSKIDIVAFLSCFSAIAPDGPGERSLTQICLEKGAKFAIGFIDEVGGAEYFFAQFMNKLDAMNCYNAFSQTKDEAIASANTLGSTGPYGSSGSLAVCFRKDMI